MEKMNSYHPIKISIGQGCFMSLWIINIFLFGVLKGVKAANEADVVADGGEKLQI